MSRLLHYVQPLTTVASDLNQNPSPSSRSERVCIGHGPIQCAENTHRCLFCSAAAALR